MQLIDAVDDLYLATEVLAYEIITFLVRPYAADNYPCRACWILRHSANPADPADWMQVHAACLHVRCDRSTLLVELSMRSMMVSISMAPRSAS